MKEKTLRRETTHGDPTRSVQDHRRPVGPTHLVTTLLAAAITAACTTTIPAPPSTTGPAVLDGQRDLVLLDGTEISGILECDDLRVPANAVVRVTGDLAIRATGDIVIEGELRCEDREADSWGADGWDLDLECRGTFLLGPAGQLVGGRGATFDEKDMEHRQLHAGDGSDIRIRCSTLLFHGTMIAGDGGHGGAGADGGRGGDVDVIGAPGQVAEGGLRDRGSAQGGQGGQGGRGWQEPQLVVLPGRGGRGGTVSVLRPETEGTPPRG